MTDEELVARLLAAALIGLLPRMKEGSHAEIGDAALKLARHLARRIRDEGALP